VRQGNNVAPSSGPLVVINQLSPVLVRFPVLESDFAPMQRAVAQHPLPVSASTNDSTDLGERGTLSFLDNAVDSLTGTVTGKASFPNFGRRMWPGELVYLTIQLQVERGVVAVPTTAIQTGQQGNFVFVVDAKNTAQSRPVVPGIEVGDMTVVQRGVNAGDKVVIDGQSRLNPGARVALAGNGAGRGGAAGTDTSAASLSANGVNGEATTNGTAAGDVAGGAVGTAPQSGSRAGGSGAIVTTNTPSQLPAVAPAPSNGAATQATPTTPATNPTAPPVARPTTPTAPTAPARGGTPTAPTSPTGRGGTTQR
jgi:hypothetical protein